MSTVPLNQFLVSRLLLQPNKHLVLSELHVRDAARLCFFILSFFWWKKLSHPCHPLWGKHQIYVWIKAASRSATMESASEMPVLYAVLYKSPLLTHLRFCFSSKVLCLLKKLYRHRNCVGKKAAPCFLTDLGVIIGSCCGVHIVIVRMASVLLCARY